MAGVKRVVKIHAGQHGENVSLQEGDKQFEGFEAIIIERRRDRKHFDRRARPSSMTTKPPNTLSMMCPASILANRRTEWLTGRDKERDDLDRHTSG